MSLSETATKLGSTHGSGLSVNANLSPLDITGKLSSIIAINNDKCPVEAFFKCGNDLELELITLKSSCISVNLQYRSLTLSKMEHQLLFLTPSSPYHHFFASNFIIRSTPTRINHLGPLISLLPSQQPSVLLQYNDTTGTFMGTMQQARITLFDIVFHSDIMVVNNTLTFSRHVRIFGNYPFSIQGTAAAKFHWAGVQLLLQGQISANFDNIHDTFLEELQSKIVSLMHTKASYAQKRIESAENDYNQSISQISFLEAKLKSLDQQLSKIKYNYLRINNFRLEKWHNITKYQTSQLDMAFSKYELAIEDQAAIDQLCNITTCDRVCISGVILEPCNKPVFREEQIPCYKIETVDETVRVPYTVDNKDKVGISECRKVTTWRRIFFKRRGWFAVIAFTVIVAPVVIYFLTWSRNSQYACKRTMYTPVETHFKDEIRTVVKRRQSLCMGETFQHYTSDTCQRSTDCASMIDDKVCSSSNEQCKSLRHSAFINAIAETEETIAELNVIFERYQNSFIKKSKYEAIVEQLEFQLERLEKEVNFTTEAKQSSELSLNVSKQHYDAIASESHVKEGLQIANILRELPSNQTFIKVNSIQFSVSSTFETPVIIPLQVYYEAIDQQTVSSYETEVVVDLSNPYTFVQRRIAEHVLYDALTSIDGLFVRKRRAIADSDVQFSNTLKENCEMQQDLLFYFETLNSTLEQLHNYTIDSLQNVYEVQHAIQDHYETVISDLSNINTNLSATLLDVEEENLKLAANALKEEEARVNSTEVQDWKRVMENLHNGTFGGVIGETCYSLTDCLQVGFDTMKNLLLGIPLDTDNELQILNDTEQYINSLQSYDNISFTINTLLKIAQYLDQAGYWCMVPPTIVVSPPPQVSIEVGSTLVLNCSAESSFSVTYKWKRNNITVPAANSNVLQMQDIEEQDGGVYECVATNDLASVSSLPTVVNVHMLPTFNITPQSVTTYYGDEVGAVFLCHAEAIPLPLWEWYFRKNDSVDWELLPVVSNRLHLEQPSELNEGWYKCVAFNNYGRIESVPVSLILVPVTTTTILHEAVVTLSLTESLAFSKIETCVATSLADAYESINSTFIKDLNVVELVSTKLKVGFYLSTNNVTQANEMNIESLEAVAIKFIEELIDLDNEKNMIIELTNSKEINITCDNVTATPTSILFAPKKYHCPEGMETHETSVICGKLLSNMYIVMNVNTDCVYV